MCVCVWGGVSKERRDTKTKTSFAYDNGHLLTYANKYKVDFYTPPKYT